MRDVLIRNLAALALLPLVCLLAAPLPLAAQSPPAPAPWTQLTIVHVAPAMIDEYIAVQREIAARARKGGPAFRIVSRTEVFGDTFRFLVMTPVQSLASFDARNSDNELAALNGRLQKYITSQQTYAIRTLPEIDNPLPDKEQPGLIVVNLVRVAPGREQDYYNVMKSDFLPHFNKAEVHHLNGTLALGGESGYIHQFYMKDFAKLDEGSPVVKALGAAGAQAVTAKFAGIVTSSELWTTRLIPDLSYGPWSPQPPATKQ
jgi:hypothetical protein